MQGRLLEAQGRLFSPPPPAAAARAEAPLSSRAREPWNAGRRSLSRRAVDLPANIGPMMRCTSPQAGPHPGRAGEAAGEGCGGTRGVGGRGVGRGAGAGPTTTPVLGGIGGWRARTHQVRRAFVHPRRRQGLVLRIGDARRAGVRSRAGACRGRLVVHGSGAVAHRARGRQVLAAGKPPLRRRGAVLRAARCRAAVAVRSAAAAAGPWAARRTRVACCRRDRRRGWQHGLPQRLGWGQHEVTAHSPDPSCAVHEGRDAVVVRRRRSGWGCRRVRCLPRNDAASPADTAQCTDSPAPRGRQLDFVVRPAASTVFQRQWKWSGAQIQGGFAFGGHACLASLWWAAEIARGARSHVGVDSATDWHGTPAPNTGRRRSNSIPCTAAVCVEAGP